MTYNSSNKNYKELLGQHVEKIFKTYTDPGLHICDLATGGGKSYTIGKLTCEYYPKYFDRIIILCVQNKLVEGMNREIDRFITSDNSLIKPTDKLVVENNPEVMDKAIKNGRFKELLEQMDNCIGEQKRISDVNRLQYSYFLVKKTFEDISGLLKPMETTGKNDYLKSQINDLESKLRRNVRIFFNAYKKHLEKTKQIKTAQYKTILNSFPALTKVYPQVEFKNKMVVIMTVHKAMYGVDPILTEKIQLSDFAENKKTLILFDESDQAAVYMRNAIIDQAIDNTGGNKRFAKGYNGYLQYKTLIDNPDHISNEYHGRLLEDSINKAQFITRANWERVFGKTKPYKSIFLGECENLEDYRRGVFFSGPAIKMNISQSNDKTRSFICHKGGDRHLRLVHSDDYTKVNSEYDITVALDKFLSLAMSNTTAIKSQFRKVITASLKNSREKFNQEIGAIANNISTQNNYLAYPTLEREIHTLFSRFETSSEFQFEQQMSEFMTNRKNLRMESEKGSIKLPDLSVYSQGVQLFQEEIDERDNQHRVRLSCREITTTPEKILVDLVHTPHTSVVLCSATASSKSVVNNYDLTYLKQTLGNKIHGLSIEDRETFDDLASKTYPLNHKIEIVALDKYEYPKIDPNTYRLPEKYKNLFSNTAREEQKDEEWLRITIRDLNTNSSNADNISFQLYRLFQFIEAYHWFYTHDDIHSMLYFQNRTGDKDRNQIHTLSCLIDGSYKEQEHPDLDGRIPSGWENKHIRISKDWEEVETKILQDLSNDKNAKLMLVSAYGSFKAGANMQYKIPDGLKGYVTGDNWESSAKELKKDWDAVYLQSPTGYLTIPEDGNEQTFEKSLYNAMLTLMMLYERGCLSKSDVTTWMGKALSNTFYFGEKSNPGIKKDKAAWAQSIIEQAVGRLCRTRNKPHTTYILFDKSMTLFFDKPNIDKSLTKEFRELARHIQSLSAGKESSIDFNEIIRCNNANYAQNQLDRVRRIALRYTIHPGNDEDFEDEDENNNIPHSVIINQIMNQCYKKTIIRKPVIHSLDELNEEDKRLTFIDKCYGDWQRHDNGECFYGFYDRKTCPTANIYRRSISPSSVRLDVLMKNKVIRDYFDAHGYATSWAKDGLILHPRILATDYAGEIGEEAFKALLLHYTDCREEEIVHLEGKDYELADFVIKKSDGTYKLAFDIKNMNPDADHYDHTGDIPTSRKRELKRTRLGCEIITVNMLEIKKESMDSIREITGLITEDGSVIKNAIERIIHLINN